VELELQRDGVFAFFANTLAHFSNALQAPFALRFRGAQSQLRGGFRRIRFGRFLLVHRLELLELRHGFVSLHIRIWEWSLLFPRYVLLIFFLCGHALR